MPIVETDTTIASTIEPEKYFWHGPQWAMFTRDLARLPHALLLHGQTGLGKNAFALRFAQALLCRQRSAGHDACGSCHNCALFRSGNHPDLLRVSPEEDSSNILVDQVRGIIDFLALKPHSAAHKIVIISPAEAMNINAANGLLKVLEEPPAGSLLLLVATHLSRVPVTIRSRCTQVAFNPPATAEVLPWLCTQYKTPVDAETLLALAGGAPLAALTLVEENYLERQEQLLADLAALGQGRGDPVACAERWKTIGVRDCLDWLHRYVVNSARSQASAFAEGRISLSFQKEQKKFSISIIDLLSFVDNVSIARRQVGTGVDETLLLEDLLIHWCGMSSTAV